MCLECMCGSVDRVSGRGGAYVRTVCVSVMFQSV